MLLFLCFKKNPVIFRQTAVIGKILRLLAKLNKMHQNKQMN